MNIRCEYCGQYYPENERSCPHCGAPNEGLSRRGKAVPQTIEELKAFCAAHRLPLDQMRFFIGEDYRGARAFGIYQEDDGSFTVYKNKSDGSRAVRYQGPDEAYAVNEIYQKLKSEIANQRRLRAQQSAAASRAPSRSTGRTQPRRKSRRWLPTWLMLVLIVIIVMTILSSFDNHRRGYYQYDGDYYYYQNNDWYRYDSGLGQWLFYNAVDSALENDPDTYYESSDWSQNYGVEDFSDSGYYSSYSGSSSSGSSYSNDDSDWDTDWDSDWDDDDWDWDSDDSWDSDWTDWDSDW